MVHRPVRHEQTVGDLGIGHALRHQAEDVHLSGCEPERVLPRGADRAPGHTGDPGLGELGPESRRQGNGSQVVEDGERLDLGIDGSVAQRHGPVIGDAPLLPEPGRLLPLPFSREVIRVGHLVRDLLQLTDHPEPEGQLPTAPPRLQSDRLRQDIAETREDPLVQRATDPYVLRQGDAGGRSALDLADLERQLPTREEVTLGLGMPGSGAKPAEKGVGHHPGGRQLPQVLQDEDRIGLGVGPPASHLGKQPGGGDGICLEAGNLTVQGELVCSRHPLLGGLHVPGVEGRPSDVDCGADLLVGIPEIGRHREAGLGLLHPLGIAGAHLHRPDVVEGMGSGTALTLAGGGEGLLRILEGQRLVTGQHRQLGDGRVGEGEILTPYRSQHVGSLVGQLHRRGPAIVDPSDPASDQERVPQLGGVAETAPFPDADLDDLLGPAELVDQILLPGPEVVVVGAHLLFETVEMRFDGAQVGHRLIVTLHVGGMPRRQRGESDQGVDVPADPGVVGDPGGVEPEFLHGTEHL